MFISEVPDYPSIYYHTYHDQINLPSFDNKNPWYESAVTIAGIATAAAAAAAAAAAG